MTTENPTGWSKAARRRKAAKLTPAAPEDRGQAHEAETQKEN